MKASSFHIIPCLQALVIAGASAIAQPETRPENLVVILSDDQGIGHVPAFWEAFGSAGPGGKGRGATGSNSEREAAKRATPNLDRLAAEGIRFTSFRTAAVCAPTRTMLMTARYPQRMGILSNKDINDQGVPASEHFLMKDLQAAGFRTGFVGKWHLGRGPGQNPNDRGFEYAWGFDRSETEKYGSKILFENGKNVPAEGWLADQMTDKAVGFIEESVEAKKPFVLYLAYNEPHAPNPTPPEAYMKHFQTGNKKTDEFFAQLFGMDTGIGRVLEALEKTGQLDRTLIMFASDNGATEGMPAPANEPFRGYKRMVLEGGVHTPLIVRAPGSPLAGTVMNEQVSVLDLLPTALARVGVTTEASNLDGRSFHAILSGEQKSLPERITFDACAVSGLGMLEGATALVSPSADAYLERDKRAAEELGSDQKKRSKGAWAYERSPAGYYAFDGRWKLMGVEGLPPMLFDLKSDPAELRDVASDNPQIRDRLAAAYAAWIRVMPAALAWDNARRKLLDK